jgi:glutathione S-transferase
VDYLGDVPWGESEYARNWYARMKSRPSFRAILADVSGALPPAAHYADPDF